MKKSKEELCPNCGASLAKDWSKCGMCKFKNPIVSQEKRNKKLRKLFDIAQEIYGEEQEKSGLVEPIPYAFVKCGGEMIVYSAWSSCSKRIEQTLRKTFP